MLGRIATNAAALAIAGLVAQLIFVSIEVAIARQLGQEDYGAFATVYVFAVTIWVSIDLGTSWRLIESGSRDPSTIAELLGTTAALKVIGLLLLWPVVAGGLVLLEYDSRIIVLFLIFFVYAVAISLQDSIAAAYTARQRMVINAAFQAGTPIAIAILVAVALMIGGDLYSVGFMYGLAGLGATTLWLVLVFRAERPRVRFASSGEILRGSYLYGISGFLSQLFYKSDVMLLSALAPIQQVGIYAAGYKLLDLAYKAPIISAKVVSPALFVQHQADVEQYGRSVDAFVRISTVAGIIPAIVCYLNAPLIIGLLFGPGFEEAALVLQVLSVSFVLKFVGGALQTVLTTRGQHRLRTAGLACSVGAGMAGHVLLIPLYGAVGAAFAVVGAETLLVLIYLVGIADAALRRLLGRRLAVAVVAGAAALTLAAVVGLGRIGASAVGLAACVGVLLAFGYLTSADLMVLRASVTGRKAGG